MARPDEFFLVSIIVPNYNHAKYLPARMDSILNQSYRDFEVIILDDCSTDHSRDIIENYRSNPKITNIVYNQENSGSPFVQWNKGVRLAKGSLIWIAESDDFCEPVFLSETVAKLNEFPSAGLVFTQSIELDENSNNQSLSFHDSPRFGTSFRESYFEYGRKELRNKLQYENTIPNASAVLFRKPIYEKVGGAEEAMKLCGDWFVWVKMLMLTDVYFISKPLNYFRFTLTSARSRNSKLSTFHERMQIVHFMNLNKIPGAGKSEVILLKSLFNNYTFGRLGEPLKKALNEKKNIFRPRVKIFYAIVLSIIDRIWNKVQLPRRITA